MSRPATLVLAVGNRSRGDDALGPLLLERLGAELAVAGRSGEFELLEDYQLQPEHALDLVGRRLALFIDAGSGTRAPLDFYAVAARRGMAPGTHALSPQALLQVYRQIECAEPPPAFALCVRGERFELGAGLSRGASRHFEAAWRRLELLCAHPEAAHWHKFGAVLCD